MARILITLLVLSSVMTSSNAAFGQLFGGRDRGEPIFTPIKNIRARAENGVLSDAVGNAGQNCRLNGKISPKAACKRCQRALAEEQEKEKDERAEEAELKQLEAEAKKSELEAKLLEEQDKERNKPWDVADDENLESPSDLLKLAAQSKQDQDLAPKKQEALNYLASLGCNKDPKVAAAILLGLKDYNVEVRMESVKTVLYAVRGPNPQVVYDPYGANGVFSTQPICATCQPQQYERCEQCLPEELRDKDCPICDVAKLKEMKKQQRKAERKQRRKSCFSCGGKGCDSCNYSGQTVQGGGCGNVCQPCAEVECQECKFCDGCKSCCTEPIVIELRKMAFDMDPKRPGCYYEPSMEVRNLALEAITLCPGIEEKEDDVEEKTGVTEEGEDEVKSGVSEADEDDAQSDDLNKSELDGPEPEDVNDELNDAIEDAQDEDNDSSLSDQESAVLTGISNASTIYQSVSHRTNAKRSNDRLIDGKIARFYDNGYLIQHSPEYLIPIGYQLYVSDAGQQTQIVKVISSKAGAVKVEPVKGYLTNRSALVQVGILR